MKQTPSGNAISRRTDAMPANVYQKLDRTTNEFRLLSPATDAESGTAWTLTMFTLDVAPQFTALSYLWGKGAETVNIKLSGEVVRITSSLACALRHVESQWRQLFPSRGAATFYLWADALCINQSDVSEREQQVALMGDLYSRAEVVMGSLGPLSEAVQVSIDTLHLVHRELHGVAETDSLQSLDWMKKYPVLFEADFGLPGDQFDANKSWKLLREFLYMPYWRRAWVVQEIVLAQKLLFFSEEQALDPDALFATLEWFKAMRQVAKQPGVTRPEWLIPSVWNFLTYDNLLGWKAVLLIHQARTGDRGSRLYKLLLACAGKDFRATDRRDLIYGTMGLTQMGLVPDYSATSSLAQLYAQFMAWWLAEVTALQAEDKDWTLNHLDLLGMAGVGQVDDDDENKDLACSIPSWAPNFPLQEKIYTPGILVAQGNADARIFPAEAPLPRVQGTSMFLPIVTLDTITSVAKVKAVKESQGLLEFVAGYVSRHAVYPNGVPGLHGVFRTFFKDILDADTDDHSKMVRFFGFIRALLHGPETGVVETRPVEALAKLGISTNESEFVESLRRAYHVPDIDEHIEKWLPMLLQPAWDGEWAEPGVLDLCLRTVLEIRELNYTCIAETKSGYLGIVPIGTKVDDEICLMHKSDATSVIRKAAGHWVHVGRCYSFGLSEERRDEVTLTMPDYRILELQ